MPLRHAVPLMCLGGTAAVSASALAGVGIGRYTVSGVNPLYTDGYRSLASTSTRPESADAFWSAQGQPARPRHAGFEAFDSPPASHDTTL